MDIESVEEGSTTRSLIIKEKPKAHGNGDDDGGRGVGGPESGGSATAVVVLSTLVAICGSYEFGAAVSLIRSLLSIDATENKLIYEQNANSNRLYCPRYKTERT